MEPRAIWTIFNQAIGANINFFGSVSHPLRALKAPCMFRINVALSGAGIFSVQRTIAGKTVAGNLNLGTALVANAEYIFDIIVEAGEEIDFQTTGACTILKMSVVEKDDVD